MRADPEPSRRSDAVDFSTRMRRMDPTPSPEASVGALLSAENAAAFGTAVWPSAPLVVTGSPTRLKGLVDHDLEALIAMNKRHTTAYLHTLEGTASALRVKSGQEQALYDGGAALAFHGLLSPALTTWCLALERDLGLLGGMIAIHAQATRRASGFDARFAAEDEIVCQARGAQRWRIATLAGEAFTEPALPRTVDLEPGTVLFLPRGTWHAGEATDSESLHMTIRPGRPTLREALEYVILTSAALQHREMGRPIARMFDGSRTRAGVTDDLEQALRRAVDAICEGGIAISPDGLRTYLRARRTS
jgi:hypothetical protein